MKLKSTIIGVALLAATVIHAQTYTTNSTGQVFETIPVPPSSSTGESGLLNAGKIILADLENATNYAIAPYASYGLNNHKIGGGVLALYNFNNFVGAGIGADYMGSFSLVSGNVQLKLPLKPLAFTKWTWAQNLSMTPFAYTGIGTPMGGSGVNNGGISTHIGGGDYFQFGHFLGGKFNIGGAYITRSGAGAYSGKYINAVFAWSKGI